MWNLTPHQTLTPCIGRQSLNHWTTREVSHNLVLLFLVFCSAMPLLRALSHRCYLKEGKDHKVQEILRTIVVNISKCVLSYYTATIIVHIYVNSLI